MTSPLGDTTSWSVLMQLAGKVNGDKELTTDELKKLLEDADANNDGVIELAEFKEAFLSAEEYSNLEEDFLEAFDAIAELDDVDASISDKDIEMAIKEFEDAQKVETPSGGGSYGGSGNGGNGGDKKDSTDLDSKQLPELKSERSDVLSDISSKRAEKEEALSKVDADIAGTQEDYNEATASFLELAEAGAENDEALAAIVSEIGIFEGQKNALQGQISEQEGLISETTTQISTISSSLSSLEEPSKTIEYFNEETQQTETQDNPAYAEYLQQKEALENELAAAEQELAKQEEELTALEGDLTITEDHLEAKMLEYMATKESAGTLTQAERDAMTAVDTAKTAYDTAKGQVKEVETQYDKEIDALQASLIAYNDAITEKELTLPEGYSSENGELTNGENNLLYLEDGKLPDGYKIVDGKIVDADENTVGLVTGDEENQQLYLIQEKEPESKGYATAYYVAANLFDATMNGDEEARAKMWETTDFSMYSPSDLALIQEIYDRMVSDYNSIPENKDKQAGTFMETAEKELNDEEATQVTYELIKNAIDKVENRIEVEPNNFEKYLEENDVDLTTATPEELAEYLDKFIIDKYGFDYKEEYYPEMTDEQLEEYIGEGGLESLKDADEATVKSKIDAILNSEELSPYEQMRLVDMIKSYSADTTTYVQNYFTNSDEFFYETIEEMTAEGSEYTTEDILEFVRQYKGVDSTSSVLGNGENIETILSIYTKASGDDEALTELNTYLNAGKVLEYAQGKYEGAELEAYTDMLFRATVADKLTEDGKLSTEAKDYGLTEEEAANLKSTYTKVEDVLESLESGVLDKSQAQYLISNIFGGDITKISDMQTVGNTEAINQIFNLFDTKPTFDRTGAPKDYRGFDGINYDNLPMTYTLDGETYHLVGFESYDLDGDGQIDFKPESWEDVVTYFKNGGVRNLGKFGNRQCHNYSDILGQFILGVAHPEFVQELLNETNDPNYGDKDRAGYMGTSSDWNPRNFAMCAAKDRDEEHAIIENELQNGRPCVVRVDSGSHYVLAVGMSEDGDILIWDSYDGVLEKLARSSNDDSNTNGRKLDPNRGVNVYCEGYEYEYGTAEAFDYWSYVGGTPEYVLEHGYKK